MALLPLAGFAADPFSVGGNPVYAIRAIANGNLVYNKSDYSETAWQIQYQLAQNGEWYNLTSGYEVSYYDAQNAQNEIDVDQNPITEAGDYWIGIEAADQSQTCSGILGADKRVKFTVAQAPLNITINNGVKDYGDELPAWTWEVADGTQFAPGDTKTNVAVTINCVKQDNDNLNYGGTHTFKSVTATAANNNYKVTVTNAATLTLTVNKANLVFKVGPAYGQNGYLFTKDYYTLEQELKVAKANVSFTGARGNDVIEPVYPTDNKISYTYALAGTRAAAANANTAGELFSTVEGANAGYEVDFSNSGITLSETDALNYNITYEKRIVCIKQIEIKATAQNSKFTYTAGNIDFTYTGAKQEPTAHKITYKWGNGNNDKFDLVKGQDYEFSYTLNNVATPPIQATDDPTTNNVEDRYVVKVVSATNAKKNFTVAQDGITIDAFAFPIKKKELSILVNPKSKEYNGQVQDFEKAYTINGFVTADASKEVTGLNVEPVPVYDANQQEITNPKPNAVTANVGKYYQQANVTNAKLTWTVEQQDMQEDLTLNYYINKLTAGYFEVTPKALTVTVKADKSILFGAALPGTATLAANEGAYAALVTISGNIQTDLNNIKGALSLGLKKQYDAQQQEIQPAIYYKEATTYPGCWVISYEKDNDGNATNQTLKNYTLTITDKNFIIGKAGFTMMAVGAEKVYDAQPVTAANLSYVAYAGNTLVTIPTGVTVAYEFQDGEDWTDEFPTRVGVYTYRVKRNAAYAPADYDGNNIDCPPATFEITKRPVKITVDNVTLHVGDNATILNKYATFQLKDNTKKTIGNDKLSVVFEFTGDVTNDNTYWNNTTKSLKAATDANGIASAITVRLANATDDPGVDLLQNGNYSLANGDIVLGKLFIKAGVITTFDVTDADIIDQLEDATDDTDADNTIDVRFKNVDYELSKDYWRVLVLPFDITPYDFCEAIGGYAIFNTLNEIQASTNTIKFSLELNKLTANQPFLVKVQKAKKVDDIEFPNVNVEYADPVYVKDGAKFIGSYDLVENIAGGEKKLYMVGSGAFKQAVSGGQPKSFNNKPLRAYFDLTATALTAAPMIELQEADGSTTAISSISADGIAVEANGWYTVNGIRLEGAPTEKGVYIHNGKKMVIK